MFVQAGQDSGPGFFVYLLRRSGKIYKSGPAAIHGGGSRR
jgi:hypothetical protein